MPKKATESVSETEEPQSELDKFLQSLDADDWNRFMDRLWSPGAFDMDHSKHDDTSSTKDTKSTKSTTTPKGTPKDELPVNIDELWDSEGRNKGWSGWVLPEYPCTDPQLEPKTMSDCNGPGSKADKFKTHLAGCPWHPDFGNPKATGSTWSGGTGSTYTYHNCSHWRNPFKLRNGLQVLASAARDYPKPKKALAGFGSKAEELPVKSLEPNVGVYFYKGWVTDEMLVSPGLELPFVTKREPECIYLDWPDYGVPDDETVVLVAEMAQWMLKEAEEKGTLFEVACMGGHGRTGTMLAILLACQGVLPGTAIKEVRARHCMEAVETVKQCDMVAVVYELVTGDTDWQKRRNARKTFQQQRKGKHDTSVTTVTTKASGKGTSQKSTTTSHGPVSSGKDDAESHMHGWWDNWGDESGL